MKKDFKTGDNAFNSKQIRINDQDVMKKAAVKDVYASSPHTALNKGVSNLAGIRTDNAHVFRKNYLEGKYNVKRGTGLPRSDISVSRLKYLAGGRTESGLLENKISQRTGGGQKRENFNIDVSSNSPGPPPEKSDLSQGFAQNANAVSAPAGNLQAGQAGVLTAAPVMPVFKQTGDFVCRTGGLSLKAVKTAVSAPEGIQTGKIRLNKDTLTHLRDMSNDAGLLKTRLSANAPETLKNVKTAAAAAGKTKTAAVYVYNIARGRAKQIITVRITKNTLRGAGAAAKAGASVVTARLGLSAKTVKTAAAAGGVKANAGGSAAHKAADYAASKAADYAAQNDNIALSGAGKTVKTVKTVKRTINTVKKLNKGLQTASKVSARAAGKAVRTGKGVIRHVSFIKNQGLKKAFSVYRNKISKSIANVVKNISQSIAKAIGRLILSKAGAVIAAVVVLLAVVPALAGAPVSAVGAMFSHSFSLKNDDGSYDDYYEKNAVTGSMFSVFRIASIKPPALWIL